MGVRSLTCVYSVIEVSRNLCVCVSVQGLDDEYQEEGKLLGDYVYQEDGDSLQTFPVMVTKPRTCFYSTRLSHCTHRHALEPLVWVRQ